MISLAQKTIDILDTSGWTQHTYLNEKGERCLVGALVKAYEQDALLPPADGLYFKVINALVRKVGGPIVEWNDAPGRTYEEVRRLLLEVATDAPAD